MLAVICVIALLTESALRLPPLVFVACLTTASTVEPDPIAPTLTFQEMRWYAPISTYPRVLVPVATVASELRFTGIATSDNAPLGMVSTPFRELAAGCDSDELAVSGAALSRCQGRITPGASVNSEGPPIRDFIGVEVQMNAHGHLRACRLVADDISLHVRTDDVADRSDRGTVDQRHNVHAEQSPIGLARERAGSEVQISPGRILHGEHLLFGILVRDPDGSRWIDLPHALLDDVRGNQGAHAAD